MQQADSAADSHAADLLRFLDACPTPYHVVSEASARLTAAGFRHVDLSDPWPTGGGRFVVADGGALVAVVDEGAVPAAPMRMIGAHTDSPGFRLKPNPETGTAPWHQLAAEVYGGPLLNSWLDRDLGLAGRVVVRVNSRSEARLVLIDRPLLRIPQLAIHLDREVNERGLLLDRQRHLTPVWALGDAPTLRDMLADVLGVQSEAILAHDLMPFDCQPAARVGLSGEFIASARLDNLVSCHAGLGALLNTTSDQRSVKVLALFDHEEVGSTSSRGADARWLAQLLERSAVARGADREAFLRALAGSTCVSADMAHATHPNYPERHEPGHQVALNAGPAIKVNANQRYATDATTAGAFIAICDDAGIPLQHFVGRNDMPCGSTIGPATSAQLGIPTIDVGVAQLGMHSVREMCGASDPFLLQQAMQAFLAAFD